MSRHDDADGTARRQLRRAPARPPRRRRTRRSTLMRITGWMSVVVVVVLVAGTLGAYLKYRTVWDSIHRVTVTDLGHRPPKYSTSALNLLVFASGSTAGLTWSQQVAWHVGHDNGDAVSETIMIMHISPGRHLVTVLNIPRDTIVPVYACAKGPDWPGQQANPSAIEQIDNTLSYGGPSCLWKTIEQQTGIRIDHFIELGYLGLVKVVNDIGGVNVCVPVKVNDPDSGLALTAGEHHINGVTFLKFWRTREYTGNGSDLQRIQRDDYLLAQTLQKILHGGLLSSPTKLLSLVTDAASSLTTDTGLTLTDLVQIGGSLSGLSSRNVQLIQAPNVPYPANVNWVEWARPQAEALFSAIAHDIKLAKSPKEMGKKTSGGSPVLDATASRVKVRVLNGSSVTGIAGRTATALTSRGFDVVGTGPATGASGADDYSYTNSVIEYASAAELPEVNTLKSQFSSVTAHQDTSLAPGAIELILGSSFTTLAPQPTATPTPPARQPVPKLAHSYSGITGNASCRSDTSAFSTTYTPGG